MNQNLFIPLVVAGALVIVSGCQSGAHDSRSHASVPPTTAPALATPANTSTAAEPTPPAQTRSLPAKIRINACGSAVKDAAGVAWIGDTGFAGGDMIERPDLAIANTKQPEIYRSEH